LTAASIVAAGSFVTGSGWTDARGGRVEKTVEDDQDGRKESPDPATSAGRVTVRACLFVIDTPFISFPDVL
jgi:hypothetical protein